MPGEPNQIIRRDQNPPPRAWSQPPPAPPRGNLPPPPGNPVQARRTPPPPPPRGGVPGYAPPQQPEPYRKSSASPTRKRSERPRRPRRRRHWGRWLLILLLIVIVVPIGAGIYLDNSLHRIDALSNYSGRVGKTAGTNWLLTGSDTRVGLTPEQEKTLSTGDSSDASGERSDTMMLVHMSNTGAATVVSLPRDSFVSIPGVGKDKLNAAFSSGGPKLLTQTVETATGLHIDHFAEIGFGGFAGMVDTLGGIDMCLPNAIDDPKAGLNLQAGCQRLNGPQALGFVRTRATPRADLDRMNNQRMFLSALLAKATNASTLANPFKLWPLATGMTSALQVDKGDHIWDLARLAWALHGKAVTTTVPIGGFSNTSDSGNVLTWDKARASRFFDALAHDQPLPADLVTQ